MTKQVDLFSDNPVVCTVGGLILISHGAGAPTDAEHGYSIGASWHDTTNGNLYINAGTAASTTWKLVTKAS